MGVKGLFNIRRTWCFYSPLGWISMERIVYAKKLMFFRNICVMDESAICKKILTLCANKVEAQRNVIKTNEHNSPLLELFNVADQTGLLDVCLNMALHGLSYEKTAWWKIVWERLWALEDEECNLYKNQLSKEKTLYVYKDIGKPFYLTWWIMSDLRLCPINQCEAMAKMVCDASLLKAHNLRLRNRPLASRFCNK